MRFLPIFSLLIFSLSTLSCANDDDICTSGEATPRMKVKFKDSNRKLIRMDSLIVSADYGSGDKTIIKTAKADSVLIPLRVDENAYTKVSFKTSSSGPSSSVKINYTPKSAYVSPACGIKRIYENVSAEVLNTAPVKAVEQNQNQILNEDKTHFFLIF